MRIYDVTVPITETMPVWPGQPRVQIEQLARIDRGDPANVSQLKLSSHTGTHVDAPLHFVKRGMPVVCPLTSGVLESITRETLIQLFKERFDLDAITRVIDRTELYFCDEAFLCGSGAEVAAVVSIDRQVIGDGKIGPVTSAIQTCYLEIARGQDSGYSQWRTPVY